MVPTKLGGKLTAETGKHEDKDGRIVACPRVFGF